MLKYRLRHEIIDENKSEKRESTIDSLIDKKDKTSLMETDYPFPLPRKGDKIEIDTIDFWVDNIKYKLYKENGIQYHETVIYVSHNSSYYGNSSYGNYNTAIGITTLTNNSSIEKLFNTK